VSERVRQALRQAPLPDEAGAADRAWALVERAYESREPTGWTRRRRGPLIALIAAGAILVAALTPPGMAVVDRFRDAVGREPSQPALVELPAPGRLLVLSSEGPWVVQQDGSKRLLGNYEDASWSPNGLFVVATRGRQLVALDPETGEPRWSLSRTEPVSDPRWSGGGLDTRIAYRAGETLHVVAGDGSPDAAVAEGVAPLAPAWMPDSHVLAYVDARSRVHVVDVDTQRELWRTSAVNAVRELSFFRDRLVVTTASRVVVLRRGQDTPFFRTQGGHVLLDTALLPFGGLLYADYDPNADSTALFRSDCTVAGACLLMPDTRMFEGPGRISNLVTSPDLTWIAAGWPAADQFLFFKSAPRRLGKVDAVSNVTAEFSPGGRASEFPLILGWAPAAP
jgi:putative pyrroloquinoline-quinone binding quinoprotein